MFNSHHRIKGFFGQLRSPWFQVSQGASCGEPSGAFDIDLPTAGIASPRAIRLFQALIAQSLGRVAPCAAIGVAGYHYKGTNPEFKGVIALMFYAGDSPGAALAAMLPLSSRTAAPSAAMVETVSNCGAFRAFKKYSQLRTALRCLEAVLKSTDVRHEVVRVLLGLEKGGPWVATARALSSELPASQASSPLGAYLQSEGTGLLKVGIAPDRVGFRLSPLAPAPSARPCAILHGEPLPLFVSTALKVMRSPREFEWSWWHETERRERVEVLVPEHCPQALILLHFAERSVKAAVSAYLPPLGPVKRERLFQSLAHLLDYRRIGHDHPAPLDTEGEFTRLPGRKLITSLQSAILSCGYAPQVLTQTAVLVPPFARTSRTP